MASDYTPCPEPVSRVDLKRSTTVAVTPVPEDAPEQEVHLFADEVIRHKCSSLEDVFALINYLRLAWIATIHRLNTDIGSQATQWGLISHTDVGDDANVSDEKEYFPSFCTDLDLGDEFLALRTSFSLDESTRNAIRDACSRPAAVIFFEREEGNDTVSRMNMIGIE